MTEKSATVQPASVGKKQNLATRFKPGQSGNPAGRVPGTRNRFSELFIKTVGEHFQTHGQAVLDRCAIENPEGYLKIVGRIVPKQIEETLEVRASHDLQFTQKQKIAQAWLIAQQDTPGISAETSGPDAPGVIEATAVVESGRELPTKAAVVQKKKVKSKAVKKEDW